MFAANRPNRQRMMKKWNFGSLFCTSSLWRYSIDVRKAAGSASFIFVECPAICFGSGFPPPSASGAIGWRTSCTSPGCEQLLRRFPPAWVPLRGNRLMRVLLNRGGGHVDTFGQGILARRRKVLGNRHKLAAVRNEAIKNFRQASMVCSCVSWNRKTPAQLSGHDERLHILDARPLGPVHAVDGPQHDVAPSALAIATVLASNFHTAAGCSTNARRVPQ